MTEQAEVLRKAANILEEFGWIRNDLTRENGCCALGAIGAARGMFEPGRLQLHEEDDVYGKLREDPVVHTVARSIYSEYKKSMPSSSLAEEATDVVCRVFRWNDQYVDDKQQVIDRFRKIADQIEIEQ